MRWTVGQKLALSFTLIVILMAAVGVFSVYTLSRLDASTEEILQEHQPILTDMAAIESDILFHSLKVDQYVTTGNRAHLRVVEDLRSNIEAHLADLEERAQGTEDQQIVQEIRRAYDTYTSLSNGLQDFYRRHPDDRAAIEGKQMRIAALLENALLAKADTLYEAKQTKAQELIQANRQLYLTYLRVAIASSLLLILLAAVLGVLISRSIVVPIGQLAEATQRIAGGDLMARAQIRSGDEMGLLASAFNSMAAQLQELIETLEQRVAERTRDLQAAADVARTTTSLLDPDQLLHQTVELVRERFDLYYVGLFLLDEEGRFAVLHAGTGEAGQQMLAQGHKLEVGGDSMIGQCTARGKARIALDVGEEAVRFDNPLLPETRSEMALPLRSRGRVIGAMTVQSREEAAFDETDIAVMQTMADQVAVAIDNARLFAEAQAALKEMEATHRHYLGRAWAEYVLTGALSGYRQTELETKPLGNELLPEVAQAMAERRPIVLNGDGADEGEGTAAESALVVPIMLRGQPVGALGFKAPGGRRQWSDDDVALAEAIAEQLALAAENLRLLDETQRRAAREQSISEVAARIRETLDIETVLKTAAQEVRQALGLPEVVIRLAPRPAGEAENDVERGTSS